MDLFHHLTAKFNADPMKMQIRNPGYNQFHFRREGRKWNGFESNTKQITYVPIPIKYC